MQEQETKRRGRASAKREETVAETQESKTEKKEDMAPKAEGTFTMEQVQKMIEEALAKRDAEKTESNPNDGAVTLMFQAEVNDASELLLGPNGKYGIITGKHAIITISKRDFIGDFRTTAIQYYLKTRNLIVIDGLTDSERKVYGLDYQEGEYLEPAVYERLIEMGDAVVEIFPKLHPTWREMIATKFADAYENGTLKCSREALMELNRISKKDYANLPKEDARRKGGFYNIIHAMNAADETDE